MQYLIPDPEIPDHYTPFKSFVTSDNWNGGHKWSRVIQKNYVKGRGWLAVHGTQRIRLMLREDEESAFSEELLKLMKDDTHAIIHYDGNREVVAIITNVAPSMYSGLLPKYKQLYFES